MRRWSGWDDQRLITFIRQHAGLKLPEVETDLDASSIEEPEPITAAVQAETGSAKPLSEVPGSAPPAASGYSSALYLRQLETIPVGTNTSQRVLRQNQPFSVRFTLDFSDVELATDDPLDYDVTVYAKPLGGGSRKAIGQRHSTVQPRDGILVALVCQPLSAGTHRLDTLVTVMQRSTETKLNAYQSGVVLQVQ